MSLAPYPPATAVTVTGPSNVLITVSGLFVPGSTVVPVLGAAGFAALVLNRAGAEFLLVRRRTT